MIKKMKKRWIKILWIVCLGLIFRGKLTEETVMAAEETKPVLEREAEPSPSPDVSLTPGETGEPEEEKEQSKKVHLGLDTVHKYENMNASFSEGYIPKTENGVVHLSIPFLSSQDLKDQQLIVDLELGSDAPFVYASYQKQVKKQIFTFDGEEMETYLYQCDVPLEQERKNGVYPVTVKATGYTDKGKAVKFNYQVFVTVTDGVNPRQEDAAGNEEPEDGQEPEELPADIPGGGLENPGGEMSGETEWEEVTHQPKLIFTANTWSQEKTAAGERKEFMLTLKNSSKKEKICNLKITAKAAEDTLMLENSSFYFDGVEPQETIEIPLAVTAAPTAEQKGIPLDFSFEYENDQGTAYTGTEQISIFISQPAMVTMEGFDLPGKICGLENLTAGLQIRNIGRAPVYNVKVELQAAGLFPMETIFAGTMETGQSFDGSMKIYVGNKKMKTAGEETEGTDAEKYGTTEGKLILTYEDAFGESFVQEQKFSTVIQKPQITELKVEKEKKETNQWWVASLVAILLLCGAAIAALGWKLKKNRELLSDFRAREEIREA